MIRTGAINWGSPINRSCGLNAGLVSWWIPRPGINGVTLYDLCRRSDGTLTNGPTYVPSTLNSGFSALRLDGSNDYVACGGAFSVIPFSLEVWFRTTDTLAGNRNIVTMGNAVSGSRYMQLILDSGHHVAYNLGGGSGSPAIASSGTYNDGKWHHAVGVTASATSHALYVDGQSAGTSATNLGAFTVDLTTIGGLTFNSTTPIQYFPGDVASLRGWSRALSDGEAMRLYSDSLSGFQQTLNRIERRWGYVAAASGGRARIIGGGLAA